MAKMVFFPIGNADTSLIKLADGRDVIVDYADMRDPSNQFDERCDLPKELRAELTLKNMTAVACFTHLDLDHVKGAAKFFHFEHAAIYQDEGRVKIKEMWVPAGVLTEGNLNDDARVIRQEARYRLKKGSGIKIFSRPESLASLLADMGLTVEERRNCIVDAGAYVPGFSTAGPEKVAFFVHSPFAWRQDDRGYEERNADSIMFQVTFLEEEQEYFAIFGADVESQTLSQIVQTTKKHKNEPRLQWDLLHLFHHCSYLSLSSEKGVDETKPVPDVAWLFENQGRDGCIIVSPSWPIPLPGTSEDEDLQPPHRQAANYYRRITRAKGGDFYVTGETPNKFHPKPLRFTVTKFGISAVLVFASAAAALVSTPVRAG